MLKNDIYPSYFETAGLLLLLLVAGIVGLPGYLPYLFYKSPLTQSIGETCVYAASFIVTIRYAANRIKKHGGSFSIPDFLQKRTKWEINAILVLCTICLGASIDYINHWLRLKDLFEAYVTDMAKMPVLAFLALVILPAVLEEFLFRGVLLRQFLKKYTWVHAIILSALCFGVSHVNPPQVIAAFISGCFLGWVYYRTYNIKYCILIHFTNNAVAWLGLMLTTYKPSNPVGKFLDALAANTNAFLIAAVVTIICIMVLKKMMRTDIVDRDDLVLVDETL
jgi:membrane protease YdiL (CAAX protease family)